MPSTATPGTAAIPLGPVGSQPVAAVVSGNNATVPTATSSAPPGVAQNSTTTSTPPRQRTFAAIWLPNLFQVVTLAIAVAFGSVGIWYMQRTDTMQNWTTKKDEWEYCDSQKDAAVLPPHCHNVLATPLEPRPYMALAKRVMLDLDTTMIKPLSLLDPTKTPRGMTIERFSAILLLLILPFFLLVLDASGSKNRLDALLKREHSRLAEEAVLQILRWEDLTRKNARKHLPDNTVMQLRRRVPSISEDSDGRNQRERIANLGLANLDLKYRVHFSMRTVVGSLVKNVLITELNEHMKVRSRQSQFRIKYRRLLRRLIENLMTKMDTNVILQKLRIEILCLYYRRPTAEVLLLFLFGNQPKFQADMTSKASPFEIALLLGKLASEEEIGYAKDHGIAFAITSDVSRTFRFSRFLSVGVGPTWSKRAPAVLVDPVVDSILDPQTKEHFSKFFKGSQPFKYFERSFRQLFWMDADRELEWNLLSDNSLEMIQVNKNWTVLI
ncbi:hypothetical protein VTL71DRAFT_8086 [Oculimacula yallundae]|uniref:Uncharacterized protein n=1 Tax=Oculimacula yallundae TaxID=86028 RepID=A0ABR4CWW9_9HELO